MPTLLVIDDDAAIRHFFRRAFPGPDVTLLTAASVADGLAEVTRGRPDVVILDIDLPDQSGLEAYHRVHQLDPRIPVIFITGQGTTATAIKAMGMGAYEYLLKPLELDQLCDLVARAFEITGLSGSAESRAAFTVPLEFVPQPAVQPSVARPAAPQGGIPIVPRYTYGSGYQGYGYYPYASPSAEVHTSARQSYMSSIPGMYGPGGMSVGPGHRDWSTGRDSPLAKPWMRASD